MSSGSAISGDMSFAPCAIVLNLGIKNMFFSIPTRSDQNIAGPEDVKETTKNIRIIKGAKMINNSVETITSIPRLYFKDKLGTENPSGL